MRGLQAVFVAFLAIACTRTSEGADKCVRVQGLNLWSVGSMFVRDKLKCSQECATRDSCSFYDLVHWRGGFNCHMFKAIKVKNGNHYADFPEGFASGAYFKTCYTTGTHKIELNLVRTTNDSWYASISRTKERELFLCHVLGGCANNSCLASSLSDSSGCNHYNALKDVCLCSP